MIKSDFISIIILYSSFILAECTELYQLRHAACSLRTGDQLRSNHGQQQQHNKQPVSRHNRSLPRVRAKEARIHQQLHSVVLDDHLLCATLLRAHHLLHQNTHVHVVQGAASRPELLLQRSLTRVGPPQA